MLSFIIETIIAAYRVFFPVRHYPADARINWSQVDSAITPDNGGCPDCYEINKNIIPNKNLHMFGYTYCESCQKAMDAYYNDDAVAEALERMG